MFKSVRIGFKRPEKFLRLVYHPLKVCGKLPVERQAKNLFLFRILLGCRIANVCASDELAIPYKWLSARRITCTNSDVKSAGCFLRLQRLATEWAR
jgi:hypothetical protein